MSRAKPPAAPQPRKDDEVEGLPPLDGDSEVGADEEITIDEPREDGADPFDDKTGEDSPIIAEFTEVSGNLLDDGEMEDDETGIDFGAEGSFLDDADEPGVGDEDFGMNDSSEAKVDGGEEGFSEAYEELRVEDLPKLDDDDSTEEDAEAVETTVPDERVELPWDDRAWEPALSPVAVGKVTAILVRVDGVIVRTEEGQVLRSTDRRTFLPVDSPPPSTRSWSPRSLAAAIARRATCSAPLDERGNIVVALHEDGRSLLARVDARGEARIVADVSAETDGDENVIALAADVRESLVWVGGAFGVMAFRAPRRM